MPTEEKRELFKRLNAQKKEISELRSKLNRINVEKEKWFKEKDKYSK
ncbi:hypothetical protein MBGDC06_00563, partial [Thermoplasmatales archaeon SCGC AB-539-C06]